MTDDGGPIAEEQKSEFSGQKSWEAESGKIRCISLPEFLIKIINDIRVIRGSN